MAGVEYEKPPLEFEKAPKRKIPYIIEGDLVMGDSTLIIERLRQTRGIDLDSQLAPRDRAISTAFRRMIKENTYWAIYTVRYSVPENWASYRETIADILAPGAGADIREAVGNQIKAGIDSDAQGHGWGRHNLEETALLTRQDLEAVSILLGDNEWMMGGDEPTTIDATVFGYIGNLLESSFTDAITTHAQSLSNVVALCDRVRARCFPELATPG
jgi:hypothetical protein